MKSSEDDFSSSRGFLQPEALPAAGGFFGGEKGEALAKKIKGIWGLFAER